jgi:hypothetical protein
MHCDTDNREVAVVVAAQERRRRLNKPLLHADDE